MAEIAITQLLHEAADGDREALDRVVAWAYAELERLASSRLRRQYGRRSETPTLEPAALVNETFLRLLSKPSQFANRRHFFSFTSRVMLDALIDYERRRLADKRGGDWVRVTLSGVPSAAGPAEGDMVGLSEALEQLEELDPRKADVVRLRVLWGFEVSQVAELLEISEPTVVRDWRFARVWLADKLGLAI